MHRIALQNSARKAAFAAAPKVLIFLLFVVQCRAHMTFFMSRALVHLPPAHMLLQSLVRPPFWRFIPSLTCIGMICVWVSCGIRTTYKAASEVSSILESRISGTAISGNVEETGRVLSA